MNSEYQLENEEVISENMIEEIEENKYNYPLETEDGKTICQLCGEEFFSLTKSHFEKVHNISISSYRNSFPDSPLVSRQTNIRRKATQKENFLMNKEKLENLEKDSPKKIIDDLLFGEERHVNEEPLIEDEEKVTFQREEKSLDPIKRIKINILNFLGNFFPSIQMDYMIRKIQGDRILEYEIITDYADPIKKINIEFPNVFWHNKSQFKKGMRDKTLIMDKWKIIYIENRGPSMKNIEEAVMDFIKNQN